MPNTELPMDLESQVVLMKKYITFRQRKKMNVLPANWKELYDKILFL